MTTCEQTQAVLLEHLYDLLEGDERRQFDEHLAGCAPCLAKLDLARGQQRMLASAAKERFDAVRFARPAPEKATPLIPIQPAGNHGHRGWVRWALAASVLLALTAGLGMPAGLWWSGRQDLQVAVADARTNRQDVENRVQQTQAPVLTGHKQLAELGKKIEDLSVKQQTAVVSKGRELLAKERYVSVTGPETIEAGAPNNYIVEVRDLANNGLVATNLGWRLVDASRKPIVDEKTLALQTEAPGRYKLSLPRDLDVKANQEVILELFALEVAKKAEPPASTGAPAKPAETAVAASFRTALRVSRPLYITHLTTDKPMYQPGETVWFRSLTLERYSLKPADELLHLHYAVHDGSQALVHEFGGGTQLVNAVDSKPLLGPDQKPIKGIGAGSWAIPPGTAGGEYTLTVNDLYGRFPSEKRKFLVNEYEKSPFRKKLEFTKKTFGPGDSGVAECLVEPAAGGRPIANQPVRATVRVDGKTYGADGKESNAPILLQTDPTGAVLVRFRLPTQMERGEASLAVTFTDGASSDTIVRTIPIILKKFYVQLYPEGGDLVAGVPNRVYFQARTTLDKPAELTGRVVDSEARVVARLETLNDPKEPGVNQGMGEFSFTPEVGKKYQLQIDNPVGVRADYTFPELKSDGVVLHVAKPVMAAKEQIAVRVHDSKGDRKLLVGVYCRGRLLAHQRITTKAKEPVDVKLSPESGIGGVYRVTVFEQSGSQYQPRAERLVYRAPAEKLDISLRAHRNRFMPGEKVFLNLEARNEEGKAAPSILVVALVDKGVLAMADEKTAKAMPTHFYLSSEVRKPEDLEFADFMLGTHPKAALALDLLLGTQGWRRFAEQDPAKFQEQYKEDAVRLMASIGQMPFESSNHQDVWGTSLQRIQDEAAKAAVAYTLEIVALQKRQQETQEEASQAEIAASAALTTLQRELGSAEMSLQGALGKLQRFDVEWRAYTLLSVGIALLVIGVAAGFIVLLRKGLAARPYFAAAATTCVLLAVGLLWLNSRDVQSPLTREAMTQASAGAGANLANDRWADGFDRQPGEAGGWGAAKGPAFGAARAEAERLMEDVPKDDKARFGEAKEPPRDNPAAVKFRAEAKAAPPPPGNVPPNPANAERPQDAGVARELRVKAGEDKGEKGDRVFFKEGQQLDGFRRARADDQVRLQLEKLRQPLGDAKDKQAMGGMAVLKAAAKPVAPGAAGGMDRRFILPEQKKAGLGYRAGGAGAGVPAPPALGGAGGPGGPGAGMGAGRGLGGGGRGGYPGGPAAARDELAVVIQPPPPIVVREYAHRRSGVPSNVRRDFTETLAWHPVVVLPDGSGKLEFDLNDSLTTFEALAFGHTVDGRLGVGRVSIESRLPFSVQPKIPIEVTNTDRIDIPVSVANETEEKREVYVRADARGFKVDGKAEERLTLDADQKARRVFRLIPDLVEGQAELKIDGRTEFFNDSVLRSIRVVPDGFPVNGSKSDVLEKVARHELVLPETWVKGTLHAQVQVYPSTLSDLQKGLEGLLREPNGCFEQTSTSNYPNILILDYLRESEQARPEVARRARELLDRGYQKLTSFECQKPGAKDRQGYEWFGGAAPPHEALTAYGLLQFRDMARVGQVDAGMVDRTRTYLMSRKDGNGGFQRNPRALDTFGRAPEDITNAYIVWALTESSKDDDVVKELDALKGQAKSSEDAYFLALVANSLLNRGQNDEGLSVLKRLAQAQKPDGRLEAPRMSITGSSGRHLHIETTALTLLAWLKANQPEFTKNVQLAVRWIGQQRDGGGAFGSTQSTILALKALIEHTKANKRPAEAGDLILYVGGQEAARLPFQPTGPEVPPLVLPRDKAEQILKPGKNDVRVELTGNNVFPYTLSWSYQTLKPASGEGCPVRLEAKLDKVEANENDTVRLNVSVKNVSGKGQAMTVAIVGLPAGLTLPEDLKQLKDYTRLEDNDTKPGRISAWEIRGRELVLYWRDLAPDAKIDVPLDLICRVPGEYRGPASRAYLYYNSDAKHWIDPLSIRIKAGE